MSERSQRFLIWWAIAFVVIYGAALNFLLHMMPPPDATMTSAEIAQFYSEHHDSIRVGATICSWTSAFMLPLFAVLTIQVYRQERGRPIWTVVTAMGGVMMSLFLMLPPLFWGVAAYTENRTSDDATAVMHELGTLTLTTTDQYYIFAWVAIVVICLIPTSIKNTALTRRYGYFTAWTAFMFEAGAFAFLPRTGPFAWDGLLVFWSPLTLFGLWIAVTSYLVLKALKRQQQEDER